MKLSDMVVEIISRLNQRKYISLGKELEPKHIRLWKMNQDKLGRKAFLHLRKQCDDSKSYDYSFFVEAKYLGKWMEKQFKDVEISSEDLLLVESGKKLYKDDDFMFLSDEIPVRNNCEFCRHTKLLSVYCKCKKVMYCSEKCRKEDIKYHYRNCPRAGEEEDESLLHQTEDSINGRCGL